MLMINAPLDSPTIALQFSVSVFIYRELNWLSLACKSNIATEQQVSMIPGFDCELHGNSH